MDKKYEKRLVAFIDILGFKDMVIKSEHSPDIWTKIYTAMQTILDVKRMEEKFKDLPPSICKPYEATVTTFSDSIII